MASPERQAALKLMEEAVLALRATAPAEDDVAEILTAWVTTAAFTYYDAEGGSTACVVYMPETMADWQTIGLLRSAHLLVEANFLEGDTEET